MADWVPSTVAVQWVPGEGTRMVGRDSRGFMLALSGGRPQVDDATWRGLKSSDLLLLAAAGCATYDLVTILGKQRQPVEHIVVRCRGEQEPDPPYRFRRIHLEYHIHGRVDPDKVARAVALLESKYCSVIVTLKQAVPISSEWHVHSEDLNSLSSPFTSKGR